MLHAGVDDRDDHARALRTAPTRPAGRTPSPGATAHCSPCSASVGRAGGGRARQRAPPRRRRPGMGSGRALGPPPAQARPYRFGCSSVSTGRVGPCGGWRWLVAVRGLALAPRLRRRSRCGSRHPRIASSTRAAGWACGPYTDSTCARVRAADGRRRGHPRARRRPRRGRGRVLLEPAGVAPGHRHAARRPRDDLRRPRRARSCAAGCCARYGARGARDIRRRLNAASAALTTLALRGLNQAVIDGRLPEAVGGEFIDANGLGGVAARRAGPADRRRLHGLRRERDARAPLRRGAARGRLPRRRARASAACAPRPCGKLRRDRDRPLPGLRRLAAALPRRHLARAPEGRACGARSPASTPSRCGSRAPRTATSS